ncbi:CotS family spore coat protein [Clostridium sp. DL1XJH146]
MMREFEIERQFDIRIESIKPQKGVYLLKTNKGDKCLKRINYGVQKLYFVYAAKEHLIENGFTFIDRYDLNIEEEPFAFVNEDIYTLSRWIQGRESDFYNDEDLVGAAKNLAKMSIASRGYDPPENSKLKTDLGRWPHLMDKRVAALDKMRNMSRKRHRKCDFDFAYLQHMNYYKKYGVRALNVLKDSKYKEICEETENEKSFCHHDYTYHNIIIDEDSNFNVIDFDYCKRELKIYDISNYMVKVLKRRDWDIKYAKLILENYNKINPIKEEEYRILFAFLLFPQRFWRLANRFYYNEVSWGTKSLTRRLDLIIDEQEKYDKFIDDFKKEYEQKED